MGIKLSDLAKKDLVEVRDYTLRTWGHQQWLRYYRGLVAVFDLITENPNAGRNRDLFRKGMRSVTYEKHVVFFAPIAKADGATVILRIIHQR